jgi:hypothetical protein
MASAKGSAVSEVSHHGACRPRIGTVSGTMRELAGRRKKRR